MIRPSYLPSPRTTLLAGAGAVVALLAAFTAVVNDAVMTGQQRLLIAAVKAPGARAVKVVQATETASLQPAPAGRHR